MPTKIQWTPDIACLSIISLTNKFNEFPEFEPEDVPDEINDILILYDSTLDTRRRQGLIKEIR